jgi:AraC-like DNA-binding protein
MTKVGSTTLAERPEMVGVYLRASGLMQLTHVPARELTDRVVSIEDVLGRSACLVAANLMETSQISARISCLESALLQKMSGSRIPVPKLDIGGLSTLVIQHRGQVSVPYLAGAAGISRQHLTRVFREIVGLSPKMYCRLTRFRAALRYFSGDRLPPAQIAADLGYADQSHLTAEFRHFSSLTPAMLADGRWFHPFIERARIRRQNVELAKL